MDHLLSKPIRYSSPHCIQLVILYNSDCIGSIVLLTVWWSRINFPFLYIWCRKMAELWVTWLRPWSTWSSTTSWESWGTSCSCSRTSLLLMEILLGSRNQVYSHWWENHFAYIVSCQNMLWKVTPQKKIYSFCWGWATLQSNICQAMGNQSEAN